MIRAKYFDKNDTEAMNKFMDTHPPRQTKDSGGITLVQEGVYIIYDDEPLGTPEQISWVTDQIRSKRAEILNGEPDLRKKIAEKPILEQEIAELEKEIEDRDVTNKTVEYREEMAQKEKDLEFKQTVLQEMENFILMSEKNKEDAGKKIAALKELLADIQEGKFVMP